MTKIVENLVWQMTKATVEAMNEWILVLSSQGMVVAMLVVLLP